MFTNPSTAIEEFRAWGGLPEPKRALIIAHVASTDLRIESEFLYRKLRSVTQQTHKAANHNYQKELKSAAIMGTCALGFTLHLPVQELDLPAIRAQKTKKSANPQDADASGAVPKQRSRTQTKSFDPSPSVAPMDVEETPKTPGHQKKAPVKQSKKGSKVISETQGDNVDLQIDEEKSTPMCEPPASPHVVMCHVTDCVNSAHGM